MATLKLYSYFRSSTSYRTRIALNLKALDYEIIPVNLLQNQQRSDDYLAINPLGGVPALIHGDFILSQSLAIIDYIDTLSTQSPLAPGNNQEQAFSRQIALGIAEDIHPLINLKTQKYLADNLGADDNAKKQWYRHWTRTGMQAIEAMLTRYSASAHTVLGDEISLADICLIPHLYSMRRFGVSLDDYPLCRAIERYCITHPAFIKAAPESQPDAPNDLEPIHGAHSPLLQDNAA